MRVPSTGYYPAFGAGIRKSVTTKSVKDEHQPDNSVLPGIFSGLKGEKILTFGLIAASFGFSLHVSHQLSSLKKQLEKQAENIKKTYKDTDKLYGIAAIGAGGGAAGLGDEARKWVNGEASPTEKDKTEIFKQKEFDGKAVGTPAVVEFNGNNKPLSGKASAVVDKFDEITEKYLSEPEKDKFPLKKGDSIWTVTAEYAPVKAGGLGEVPVALQNNFNKLGMNTYSFVPMYVTTKRNDSKGIFKTSGFQTYYTYGKDTFNIEKIVEFEIPAEDRELKKHNEKVEFYIAKKKNGQDMSEPLIFVKNDLFKGESIYSGTYEHPEVGKFALFSKSVYELMKALISPDDVKSLKIADKREFKKMLPPQGIILNDWHASPIAAMVRYKSRLENADGKFSYDKTPLKQNGLDRLYFPDIKILTIAHNAKYQGAVTDKKNIEYILNTMFDEYTDAIVNNVKLKHDGIVGRKDDNTFVSVIAPYSKNRQLNMLNFGLIAGDYFCPVSQNYAKELVNNPDRANVLNRVIRQKNDANRVVGIVNGHDKSEISMEASANKQPFNFGFYDENTDINEIIRVRNKNKAALWNNFIVPIKKGNKEIASNVSIADNKSAGLPFENMTEDIASKTPVLGFVGRLTRQKGTDILAKSIRNIYDSYSENYPGKEKPIFIIVGVDGEKGEMKKFLVNLKEYLPVEDAKRVIYLDGYVPSDILAGCDFAMMPSRFEPCGLVQMEAFAKGTPVIASNTGGLSDTVNKNPKHPTGIIADNKKEIRVSEYTRALNKALDMYFNNKEQYKSTVQNCLKEDFSWILPDKKGPVFEYLKLFGVNIDDLKDLKKKKASEQ